MKNKLFAFLTLLLLSTLNPQLSTFAQGTAFTYQGRFTDSGSPYTGNAEFQPTLWNAVSGGSQVGTNSPATVIVGVTNGLFTLPLNFGASPFAAGADRWLQVEVRTDIGTFTLLSPRQQLTPTPYAITASKLTGTLPASQLTGTLPASQLTGTLPAGLLSGSYGSALTLGNAGNSFSGNGAGLTGLNGVNLQNGTVTAAKLGTDVGLWTVSGANVYRNGGNVGIGTVAPGNTLEVVAAANGDGIRLTGATTPLRSPGYHLYDDTTQRGTLGLAEGSTAFSTDAVAGDVVLRANTGRLLLQNGTGASALAISGNNVGIGTTSPTAKLHVADSARIDGSITIPTTTRFYSLSPFAFHPTRDDDRFEIADTLVAGVVVRNSGTKIETFSASVNLPHGAIVTRFAVTVVDTDIIGGISVELMGNNMDSRTPFTMASVASGGITAPGIMHLVDTTISNAQISNDVNAYWVEASWAQPFTVGQELLLGSVRIDYTITTPLP